MNAQPAQDYVAGNYPSIPDSDEIHQYNHGLLPKTAIAEETLEGSVTGGSGLPSPARGMTPRVDEDPDMLNMSANVRYMIWFNLVVNLSGAIIGYSLAYQNQLVHCINAKFNFEEGKEAN